MEMPRVCPVGRVDGQTTVTQQGSESARTLSPASVQLGVAGVASGWSPHGLAWGRH